MALYKCPFCKKEIEDGIESLVEHRREECEQIQMAGMTPEERLLMHVFGKSNREKEAMDIKSARRKSFDVTYVVVTEENIEEVAAWCGGEIGGEGTERFVKVTDKNAISTRQAKAFVDDYVLKMSATGTSFKAFTEKAFNKSYEPYPSRGFVGESGTVEVAQYKDGQRIEQKVARSAKSGQFVSHEEAKANPDTTVVEKILLEEKYGDHPEMMSKAEKTLLEGTGDFDGDTQIKVSEDFEGPEHGQPYWEVHEDETVYFNAAGERITKAEFDAWGK